MSTRGGGQPTRPPRPPSTPAGAPASTPARPSFPEFAPPPLATPPRPAHRRTLASGRRVLGLTPPSRQGPEPRTPTVRRYTNVRGVRRCPRMDEQRESPCTVRGASGGSRRGSGLVQRGPVRVFRSFASSPARLSGGARLVAASSKTAWLGAAAVSGAASVCHGTASASQRGVTAAAGTSGRPKRPASLCVLSLRLVESRRTGSSRGPRRLGHPPWERASCPPPPGGLRGGGYGAGGRRLR